MDAEESAAALNVGRVQGASERRAEPGLRARVTNIEYLGSLVRYTLTGLDGWTMLIDAAPHDGTRQAGDETLVTFSPDHAQVFPRETP